MFNDRNYTFLNFSSLHGFLSLKISLIILLFIIFVDFVILNYRNDIFFKFLNMVKKSYLNLIFLNKKSK